MRSENAVFLREIAGDSPELLREAHLFEKSAWCFKIGFNALIQGANNPKEAQAIGKWLRETAADEREAGKIFLAIEEHPGSKL